MTTAFKSCFSQDLKDYLAIKEYELEEKSYRYLIFNLTEFDTYLFNNGIDRDGLTEEVITGWISSYKNNLRWTSIALKITYIRGFIKYLTAEGINAYMPPYGIKHDDYIPYIFSEKDIKTIFELVDSIPLTRVQPDKDIQIKYPTMIRMIYGCGFRLGEVINLKMGDIDLDLGTVKLKNTKFNKERLVPMHSSLTDLLRTYCCLMGITNDPDAWVFPGVDKTKHITERVVRRKFETILRNANLSLPGREFGARGICLHCFRHSFAINSFKKGELEGRELDTIIPFLSIYLGHKSLKETEKYLKFDATDIFPETMDAFNNFTHGMFPEVNYE